MSSDLQFSFKGPPSDLRAATALVWSRSEAPLPEIEIHGSRYVLRSRPRPRGSGTVWILNMPPSTPPGATDGLVHLGGKTYRATVEVSEKKQIVVEPGNLTFDSRPGAELAVTVLVRNEGNVPQKLEGSQTIRLREASAISRGIRKAFKDKGGDLTSRLIGLGEHLSSEPWVDAAFDMKADFAQLNPGEQKNIQVRLHLQRDLQGAAEWTGTISLLGLAVAVTLRIAGTRKPPATPMVSHN